MRGVMRGVVLVAVFGMMLSLRSEDAKFLDKIPAKKPPAHPAFLLFFFVFFYYVFFFFVFDSSLMSKQMPSPSLISTWASVCRH